MLKKGREINLVRSFHSLVAEMGKLASQHLPEECYSRFAGFAGQSFVAKM